MPPGPQLRPRTTSPKTITTTTLSTSTATNPKVGSSTATSKTSLATGKTSSHGSSPQTSVRPLTPLGSSVPRIYTEPFFSISSHPTTAQLPVIPENQQHSLEDDVSVTTDIGEHPNSPPPALLNFGANSERYSDIYEVDSDIGVSCDQIQDNSRNSGDTQEGEGNVSSPQLPEHSQRNQYEESGAITKSIGDSSSDDNEGTTPPNSPVQQASTETVSHAFDIFKLSMVEGGQFKIPYFSGDTHDDVNEWIEHFDSVGDAAGWTDGEKLRKIRAFLRGPALDWYNMNVRDATKKPADITELVDSLKAYFLPEDYDSHIKKQLRERKQKLTEPVASYIAAKLSLINRSGFTLNTKDKIDLIVEGLLDDIKNAIIALDI